MLGNPPLPNLLRHMQRMGELKRAALIDMSRLNLLRMRSRAFYAAQWSRARDAQEAAVCVYLERREARARARIRLATREEAST